MKVRLRREVSAKLHQRGRVLVIPLLRCRATVEARHFGWPLPIRDRPSDHASAACVVVIHKKGGRIRAIEADRTWLRTHKGFSTAWRRLGCFLHILTHPDIADGRWKADLSDWVHEEGRVLGFCSNHAASLLVPDRGFHQSHGYAQERRRAAAAPSFEDRNPAIVWRGSATGQGMITALPMEAANVELRQRVRMCLLLRDLTAKGLRDVDAKFAVTSQMSIEARVAFQEAGIAGEFVPQPSWCRRQFAIDIDGVSNAFSNLFIRLLYGCCVIKVGSPFGFRQWYYDRLEPWHHYIPVAADLSDLAAAIEWCRGHPRECRDVAAAGQRLAMSMTPETERASVVESIRRVMEHDQRSLLAATSDGPLADGSPGVGHRPP